MMEAVQFDEQTEDTGEYRELKRRKSRFLNPDAMDDIVNALAEAGESGLTLDQLSEETKIKVEDIRGSLITSCRSRGDNIRSTVVYRLEPGEYVPEKREKKDAE